MAYYNDEVLDQGLDWAIAVGDRLHLCSADPTGNYAAVTTSDLGNAAIALGAAEDGAASGRRIVCPQTTITPGDSGTATHWAITDNSAIVVASGILASSQAVSTGVDVTISAYDAITLLDAT